MKKPLPSAETLRQLLDYNPETGVVSWRVAPSRNVRVGDPVESRNGNYKCITINKRSYKLHRVIWKLVYGEDPMDAVIDHVDRDPLNNKLSNLRLLSHSENNHNEKVRSTNTSGTPGVYWDRDKRRWRAFIGVGGRRLNLGRFKDFNEAARARTKAEEVYFPDIRVE